MPLKNLRTAWTEKESPSPIQTFYFLPFEAISKDYKLKTSTGSGEASQFHFLSFPHRNLVQL